MKNVVIGLVSRFAVTFAFATALAAPRPALAQDKPVERCSPRQVLARLETKVCPATALRPAVVLKRACCTRPNGKTRCKSFKQCPRRSPS